MEKGTLGAIAAGAHADLLVVDGDPLADLAVLLAPEKNLRLIMKAGVMCMDTLTPAPGRGPSPGA